MKGLHIMIDHMRTIYINDKFSRGWIDPTVKNSEVKIIKKMDKKKFEQYKKEHPNEFIYRKKNRRFKI